LISCLFIDSLVASSVVHDKKKKRNTGITNIDFKIVFIDKN